MTEKYKCCACDVEIDADNGDYGWSSTKEDYLCIGCRENDEESASTVIVVTGSNEPNINGQVKKYFIGQHVRMTEDGDDMWGTGWEIKREWVSSDAWRGHYDTTIEGWSPVMEGWTTGGWDDETGQRKQLFNDWAQSVCTQEIILPMSVAIITDPTSNVFSAGISVLTPNPEELKQWLGGELKDLQDSLL